DGQTNYILDSCYRHGPSSCEAPMKACQAETSRSHAKVGVLCPFVARFLGGNDEDSSSPTISASGSGRCRAAGPVAHCEGANLSGAANQLRGAICGRWATRWDGASHA